MIDLSSLGLENPEEILRAIEKYKCEQSLLYFFERAWQEIDPAPLKVNWHHSGIAAHLTAVAYGEIRRLVCNVPPRPVAINALVDTKRGLVPLGEIVVGDFVLTHKRRWRQVTAVHDQGIIPVLRIVTDAGVPLVLAPDHPVLTPDGWLDAGELKNSDVIGIVPSKECGAETVTLEEARLLGYLVGDGHCSNTPNITCKDDFVAADIVRCAATMGFSGNEQKYCYTTRRVSISAPKFYTRMSLKGEREEPGRRHKGYKGPVLRWLARHELEGKNSYTKRVPKAILTGTDDIISNYLGAYWSADGFIVKRGVKRNGTERDDLQIGCDSVSYGLMLDTQQLLRRLGINSLVRIKRNEKIITKKQGIGYTSYHLSLRSQDDCWKFAQRVKLVHAKDEIIRLARRRRFDFDRDIWGEVVSRIEDAGQEHCKCLTVKEDSSFIANGIAVHNTSKSILVNVCYPAWIWTKDADFDYPLIGPQVKFMCISYGQRLSTEIAILARRLVMSDWYQSHWGDKVKILDDQGRIDNFGNSAGGFRIATSMTGATLGRGASIRIIDDAMSVDDANSQTEVDNVVRTYREALQTRETDPSTSAEIIIMQRLGEDDLTGYVLKSAEEAEIARKQRGEEIDDDDPNNLVHVMYPMLHDPNRHCTTAWFDDPRTEQDELLWPEQFPWSVVENYRQKLGPFAFAGQFQQKPVPRGGGIFQEDWFEAWPPLGPDGKLLEGYMSNGRINYPAFEYVVACVDTAFTEKEENDPCAMIVLGIFRAEGKGRIEKRNDGTFVRVSDDYGFPKVMIVFAWEKHLTIHGPPQQVPAGVSEREWNGPEFLSERQKQWGLVEWVTHTCKRYKVDHLQIETQAAGHTLQQELQRQQQDQPWGVHVEVVPAQGTKVARAYAVQGIVSSHQIYVPTYIDGTYPSWCVPLMQQILTFPKTRYKDMTDTFTAALKHLRDIGILERREDWDKAEELSQLWTSNKRATIPYELG